MRLSDFAAILLDVDGTLCIHHRALPGAAELVRYVQSLGKTVALVTNNSAVTMSKQVARMQGIGIDVPAERIYTSGRAMADWIRSRFTKPRVFNFAGEALHEELADVATFVESPDEPVDVVCVGTHLRENSIEFDYDRATCGLHHLRKGAELLIGCADRVYMFDGLPEFGSGAWGALFAFAADVPRAKLHYAGKPDAEFFLHLCERLDVKPQDCLLVGDNLESDVAGGLSVGMTTALVLTGVATRADLEGGKVRPHGVFEDLNEMLKVMR
ncbi:MAG: HAD-IIA family hydrolase [Phycisphaeraceae bacterium]